MKHYLLSQILKEKKPKIFVLVVERIDSGLFISYNPLYQLKIDEFGAPG